MLPVVLLDPQPGELILDLCAAPGNKTIQMAIMMNSAGLIVANDRSEGRLGILRRSISRLGITNVGVTRADAVGYQGAPALFDRVLADVPCSGEGTLRRWKKPFFPTSDKRRQHLRNVQIAILTRAIKLCKPGGTIVYSTCTFAPEENEAIVDAVLANHAGRIALAEVNVPGLHTTRGLTQWQDETYHEDLSKTVRIWPHHNDTGGFFAAVLRKSPGRETPPSVSHQEITRGEEQIRFISQIEHRFGIPPHEFANLELDFSGNKHSFLSTPHPWPESIPSPIQRGMPLARVYRDIPKLKTGAAMALAGAATRNVIDLTKSQVEAYVTHNSFELNTDQIALQPTHGYVMMKYDAMFIGLGFLRKHGDRFEVESQLPKHWLHAEVVV